MSSAEKNSAKWVCPKKDIGDVKSQETFNET